MTGNVIPPGILSFEFHTKFFPRLLWSRLGPNKKEVQGAGFNHNMEFTVMLVLCVILAAIGLPSALNRGSVLGWILGILGLGGVLAILISSIVSRLGARPSYEEFLIWIFLFFVFLGLTAGIYAGKLGHSLSLGLLSGILGVSFGYVFGIFAGLWFQYLGWIAPIVDMFSGLAIIGMITVDLVLLCG
jgi:hypothetical protein